MAPGIAARAARASAATIGVVALALLLWRIAAIILLAFVGVLFAIFLRAIARKVSERLPVSQRLSIAILVPLLLSVVVLASALSLPGIMARLEELSRTLAPLWIEMHERLDGSGWGRMLSSQIDGAGSAMVDGALLQYAGRIASLALAVGTAIFFVLFVGLYLALNPEPYVRGVLLLVHRARRARISLLLDTVRVQLERWLIGRLAAMACIAVLTVAGLLVLGIPLAFTLGILAGVLSFIPNVGPIASAVVAIMVALPLGIDAALGVLALFVGVQIVESYLVTPYIERRAVEIPQAFLLTMQLVMALLFGLLGLLVATPVAVILLTSVRMLYVEDVLKEKGDGSASTRFIAKRARATRHGGREGAQAAGARRGARAHRARDDVPAQGRGDVHGVRQGQP